MGVYFSWTCFPDDIFHVTVFFRIFQTDAAATCDVSTATDDDTKGDNSDVSKDTNQVKIKQHSNYVLKFSS